MKTPTTKQFLKFHPKNPKVYELFKKFTFEAIAAGHKNLSAYLIVNRIRWETNVVTTDKNFKIDNNLIPYYARVFANEYPEHKGFFRTKPLSPEAEEACQVFNLELI